MTVDTQILRSRTANLEFSLYDSDGDLDDATTGLTVGVTSADGTEVIAAGTAATDAGASRPGVWTKSLTAAQTGSLGILTATWKASSGNTLDVTTHEVVSGFYFEPGEFRDTEQAPSSKFDDDRVKRARRQVEEDFERICDVAFLPRYARERFDGTGTTCILLPHTKVRTIRTVRVYSDSTTYTSFDSTELAALDIEGQLGIEVIRTDGNTWTSGYRNIVVEYEHGYIRPPQSVKEAAMRYARHVLTQSKSGLSQRFIFEANTGATIGLARAEMWKTGIDEVDSILQRFSLRVPGFA